MILSDAIQRINNALRGTDDTVPTGDDYDYWLDTLNRKKDELYTDLGKQWSFIYKNEAPIEAGTVETTGTTALTGTNTYFTDYNVGDKITVNGETIRTIATIVSDTSLTVTVAFSNTAAGKTFTRDTIISSSIQSYSVHRSLLGVSDKLFVLTSDGQKHYLNKVHPQEISRESQEVYLSGGNPELLTFSIDFESDDVLIGGTLIIPGYYMPDNLVNPTDQLPVPDPNWLVIATASEIAFSDIVYEDRAEALNARATSLWNQMVARNRRGEFGNTRKMTYKVKRITDTRTY